MLPDLLSDLGATIQSMGSDSSLPNLLVPCTGSQAVKRTFIASSVCKETVVDVASCQHANGLWNVCPCPIIKHSDGFSLKIVT